MKYTALVMIIASALLSVTKGYSFSDVQDPFAPRLVSFTVEDVPEVVSSETPIQFRLIGEFANSCMKPVQTQLKYNEADHSIIIYQYAYRVGEMCLQRMTPFDIKVNLGQLPAGTYTLIDGATLETLQTFKVVQDQ